MTRRLDLVRRPTLLVALPALGLIATILSAPAMGASPEDCAVPGLDDRCEAWVFNQDTSAPEGGWNGYGDDEVYAVVASDDLVFATGMSAGETADDHLTVALDGASGATRWTARLPSVEGRWHAGYAIALSADQKQVYTAGETGSSSNTMGDAVLVAHDATSGAVLWKTTSTGPRNSHEAWSHVSFGPDGGPVYVAGTQDGDSGGGDLVIAAYEPLTGDLLWKSVNQGPAPGPDSVTELAVSPSGDRVFMLARASGKDGTTDYYTSAYEAADTGRLGERLWTATYSGSMTGADGPEGLAVAPDGSRVFVTGSSTSPSPDLRGVYWRDYVTVAYDARTGERDWVARYDSEQHLHELAFDVDVAPDGSNVFVTGVFYERPTVFAQGKSLPAPGNYGTVAYEASTGEPEWVSVFSGPADSADVSYLIEPSHDGTQVYIGGWSDPIYPRQSPEAWIWAGDFAIVALDARTGSRSWAARYGSVSPADSYPNAMDLSPDGKRLVAGGAHWYTLSETNAADWGVIAYAV